MAVLWISMLAQRTVTEAESESEPSLVVETEAVLSMMAQLAEVVTDWMCTEALPAAAIEPKSQLRTPAAIEQLAESSVQLVCATRYSRPRTPRKSVGSIEMPSILRRDFPGLHRVLRGRWFDGLRRAIEADIEIMATDQSRPHQGEREFEQPLTLRRPGEEATITLRLKGKLDRLDRDALQG